MQTTDQILGEFTEAWKAGRRPAVAEYVARAPEPEREELARRLASWLAVAPTPDYDEATLEQVRAEPLLTAALERAELARSPYAERVVRLRERAGLAVAEVARRLVASFGLKDERRATEYLEQLESGELDEGRLSRRLIGALASVLGADRMQLEPRAAAAGGQAFFRADADAAEWVAEDIEALSLAALAPAPAEMDELDRLFLGGPEG